MQRIGHTRTGWRRNPLELRAYAVPLILFDHRNATEVVNKGTDGYIIKPVVDMDIFINTIREHLKKQEEARRYSEQKVKEFIETRVLQKDRVPKNRSGRRRR
jgi:glycosyltransferase involved in cell wall biosynthesis